MNRQYIGARYVPKFFEGTNGTDWESGVAYEPLTIVTYLGNSYTSKIPVPAGVGSPNNNPTYWASTGIYSAQIEEYREEVAEYKEEVDLVKGQVNISDKKVLFVSDSFGTQSPSNWITEAKSYLGLDDEHGISVAVSGTAFTGGSFLSQIQNWSGDKESVTDIVVGGGLNDSTFNSLGEASTALSTAIREFATYAKTNYPNAKLWLGFMGNALDNSSVIAGRTLDKRLWCKYVYKTTGIGVGFTFIEDVETSLCVSDLMFATDRLHPSAAGSRQLGMVIANALRGRNNKPYYPPYVMHVTAVDGASFNSPVSAEYHVEGDNITVNISSIIEIIGTKYATFNHGDGHELFTFDALYFNKPHTIFVPLRMDNYGGKTYQNFEGELVFSGNKATLFTGTINATNNGFLEETANSSSGSLAFTNGLSFTVPNYKVN